jgi:hypothetical protein
MKTSTFLVPCACASVLLAACTTVDFEQKKLPDQAPSILSPETNQVPFALRSSNLLLYPAASSSSAAKSDPASIVVTNICDQKTVIPKQRIAPNPKQARAAIKRRPANKTPPSNANDTHDATPPNARAWATCLNGMRMVATPAKGDIYLATFHGDNTISTVSLDGQPLLLKTLSISAGNATSTTITNVGTNVVAGFAIGGTPLGWAAVGLASLWEIGSAVAQTHITLRNAFGEYIGDETVSTPTTNKPELVKNLCAAARQQGVSPDNPDNIYNYDGYSASTDGQPVLNLPVAVAMPPNLADQTDCWTPLPTFSSAQPRPLRPQWFYRIRPVDVGSKTIPNVTSDMPPVIQTKNGDLGKAFNKTTDFFSDKNKDQSGNFPTSACRAVEVDITWWQELAATKPVPSPAPASSSTAVPSPTVTPAPNSPLSNPQVAALIGSSAAQPATPSSAPPPAVASQPAVAASSQQKYQPYNITVADPDIVQQVAVRKNQVINVLTVCGGYASSTPAPTSNTDIGSAVVQATANALKAQATAQSSSSK